MASLFKKLKQRKKKQEKELKEEKKEKLEAEKQKPEKESKVKKAEPAKKEAKRKAKKKKDSESYKYLLHPLITEKATDLSARNQYVFVVPKSANKTEIAKRIENVYGVVPKKVRCANFSGKQVRYGRYEGKTKDWKKAIVILNPEDKIEIYEGV